MNEAANRWYRVPEVWLMDDRPIRLRVKRLQVPRRIDPRQETVLVRVLGRRRPCAQRYADDEQNQNDPPRTIPHNHGKPQLPV